MWDARNVFLSAPISGNLAGLDLPSLKPFDCKPLSAEIHRHSKRNRSTYVYLQGNPHGESTKKKSRQSRHGADR
jgi:hypothetical protein